MYIGDLHIHSRYSRATSKELTPEHLDLWAGKKGINIVGTGDFTHPAWRAELAEKLEPAEPGLYMLKRNIPYSARPYWARAAPFCYQRGNQLHLQEKRPCAQGTQPYPSAQPGSSRSAFQAAGSHRQHTFGRTPHPGIGLSRSFGHNTGGMPGCHLCSGPHLDPAFFTVRGIFRF